MNTTHVKMPKDDLRWLLNRVGRYWPWQLASVALLSLSSLASFADPLAIKWLIDSAIPRRNLFGLVVAAGLIFVAYSLRGILDSWGAIVNFNANQKMLMDLRLDVLRHMSSLSADYHERTPPGAKFYIVHDLINELGNLCYNIIPYIVRAIVLTTWILIGMIILSVPLSLLIAPLVPVFFLAIRSFHDRLQSASNSVQSHAGTAASFLQEHLSSLIQVQLLAAEHFRLKRAFHFFANCIRAERRRNNTELGYGVTVSLVVAAGIAAVLGYGGFQVASGALSLGSLMAFYSYLTRLFDSVYFAADANSRYQRFGPTVHQIRSVLDLNPSVMDSPGSVTLNPSSVDGSIQVRDVCFGYGDRRILHSLRLEIQPRTRVALVGSSGTGKSTLAKLIARLHDVNSGSILIDNNDVRGIRLSSMRQIVCYVPQKAALFDGSIEENVVFGAANVESDILQKVGKVSHLASVVEKCHLGWQEPIGPSGGLLSGGERQRIAIARAIVRRPKILIFDEATSEIDAPTERSILELLVSYLPESTFIFISHRLSALTWVDKIIVLEEGQIVDSGKHAELYVCCGLYSRLYDLSLRSSTQESSLG
jgi:ABC-type bacteriocin/lantibiotic exporter with double-glycine peptidase domain